jgi:catechol-2,3-dioxygenase
MAPDDEGRAQMTATLRTVVIDTPDIRGLSAFYRDLAGWNEEYVGEDWVTLATPDGYRVAFQLAPDLVPAQWPDPAHPQQFHLDVQVPDLEAAAGTAEKLGAVRLGGGDSWHTLADPSGHPFDLCRNSDNPSTLIYAVTIDCPDPGALARFYADLLGMQLRYEGDEGALIGADGQGQLMFQRVATYNAPHWPDRAHPQQYHLDLIVDDVESEEPRALALGATKLPGGGEEFRVYADPAGHPFCLTW